MRGPEAASRPARAVAARPARPGPSGDRPLRIAIWLAAALASAGLSATVDLEYVIDGEFTPASDDGSFKTVNPATEEVLAEVAEATEDDVDRAVRAARRAQETVWGPMPGRERAKYLFRITRLLA